MLDALVDLVIEKINKEIVEFSVNEIGKAYAKLSHKVIIDRDRLVRSLNKHTDMVADWSSSLSIGQMSVPRPIDELFVNLSMMQGTLRDEIIEQISSDADPEHRVSVNISDLPADRHSIIFGELGAGKTTTLQYFSHQRIMNENRPIIVIFLRDVEYNTSLFDVLIRVFDIDIVMDSRRKKMVEDRYIFSSESERRYYVIKEVVLEFLSIVKPIILLDGFDEINLQMRERIAKEMKDLISGSIEFDTKKREINVKEDVSSQFLSKSGAEIARTNRMALHRSVGTSLEAENEKRVEDVRVKRFIYTIIITSRPGELREYTNDVDRYEILPLTDFQRSELVSNWLSINADIELFWNELNGKTYADMSRKPLMLSILCSIFSRYRLLPPQPKTIYKKAINLYLEEWDAERGFKRDTKYSQLSTESKFEFLAAFAFYVVHLTNSPRPFFDQRLCKIIYGHIHDRFDLPAREATEVAADIETTSGVFRRAGYDKYEFVHKSLQEYLVGDYLSRLGDFDELSIMIENYPNELAIAIALSADPNLALKKTFRNRNRAFNTPSSFAHAFLTRLIDEHPGFSRDSEVGGIVVYLLSLINAETAVRILDRFCEKGSQRFSVKDYVFDRHNNPRSRIKYLPIFMIDGKILEYLTSIEG